jgi:branched-chain amino acid transport system permease protein
VIGVVALALITIRLLTDTVLISQMALGLGTGSLIAGIAVGVVLTYRGSGVVDFSKGAVAILIGYVFNELRTKGRILVPPLPNPLALVEGVINSSRDKADWIDLPNWPTFIDLPGDRQTFASALVISILFAALLGLLLHFLVFRPLRFAPPLAKVVASVGLFIVIQAVIQLRFGGTTLLPKKILGDEPRHFFGDIVIPQNQLILALLVIAVAALLYALFRFTRFGLATRAAAENEKGAIVLGFSPDFLAGANWVLATVIVGLFGIIVSPITTLDPISVPLLIVPALGAALLGSFTSFGITVAAGLGIGMLQVLAVYYSAKNWFPVESIPAAGLAKSLPFIVIVIAMIVRGKSLPERGTIGGGRLPFAPAPRRVPVLAVLATAATLLGLFRLGFDWRQAIINTLVFAVIALSLVVLTGFVGQISLAQGAIAGTAGFALSKYFSDWPFPLGPVVAALIAALFGLAIAIPALRVRGVNLAVVTLAAAVAIEELVFKNPKLAGTAGALPVPPPKIGGKDFGPNNIKLKVFGLRATDRVPPNVWFGVLCLIFVIVLALVVVNVRRSGTGRRFLTVRGNERAAAAAGVSVAGTKMLAFALSAFIAGLGGVLSGYRFGSVTPLYFGALNSLLFLAFAYLGGISSVMGAMLAGTLAPNGVTFTALEKWFNLSPDYVPLIGGIGLIFSAIRNPEGLAGAVSLAATQIRHLLGRRSAKSPPSAEVPVTATSAGGS